MNASPDDAAGGDRPTDGGRPSPDDPAAFNRWLELLLYGLGPASTLAAAPILAHGLGPDGRGQYGVAIAVAQLVGTLGGWGQAEIFLKLSRSDNAHYRLHSRISWLGGTVASLVSAVVMLALRLPLSAVLVTAIWVPVVAQIGLWRSASIARNQLKQPALDGALGPLFRLAAFGALAGVALLTVESALFAYQATLALGSILTVGFATRRSGLRAQQSDIHVRALLISGTGIITFNMLHAVTLRADLIVLQIVSNPVQVGLYAAPVGLTAAAMALSAAFKPRVQAAAFSAEPLRGIVSNCIHVVVLGALGSIVLWVATPLAVSILFGPEFKDAEPIMRMLVIAIVPFLMVDLIFGALIVLGRQRDLILVAAGSAVITLTALVLLCPRWGAQGAAVATFISYALSTALGFGVLARAVQGGR